MLLVFGSINVDFVYSVETLPRPGETLMASDFQVMPGGKGANQAVAAARAGAKVMMAGSVGSDPLGDIGIAALKAAAVDVGAVSVEDGPSGTATISVEASGENAIVVASGANALTRAAAINEAQLASVSTLLLQMEVPHGENWALLKRARTHGICSILNLAPFAPVPADALRDTDILICNEVEFQGLIDGLQIEASDMPLGLAAASAAAEASIVVTLGKQGVMALHQDVTFEVPVLNVTVKDTTGAGDAFCGAFAAAIDAEDSFELALRKGSVAGGLACRALGAQASAPDTQAIDAALKDLGPTIIRD